MHSGPRALAAAVLCAILALGAGLIQAKEEKAGGAKAGATGAALSPDWFYGKPDQRALQDVLVGQPMPPLPLTEWIGGELKPADIKGKVLVIDFWATWCRPCIMAMPHNNELATKYKDQGVLFLGVCTSRMGQEKMAAVAASAKVNYPQGRDAESKAETAWKVQWYPTYAIVDRQGIVRGVGLLPSSVEPAIQQLLAESPKKSKK